jgi:hypothetical protein
MSVVTGLTVGEQAAWDRAMHHALVGMDLIATLAEQLHDNGVSRADATYAVLRRLAKDPDFPSRDVLALMLARVATAAVYNARGGPS